MYSIPSQNAAYLMPALATYKMLLPLDLSHLLQGIACYRVSSVNPRHSAELLNIAIEHIRSANLENAQNQWRKFELVSSEWWNKLMEYCAHAYMNYIPTKQRRSQGEKLPGPIKDVLLH
jgi:hypothetical protein